MKTSGSPWPRRSGAGIVPLLRGGAGLLVFWAAWELAATWVGNDAVLPGPRVVLWDFERSADGDRGLTFLGIGHTSYAVNLAATTATAVAGWLAGGVIGVAAGLAAARRQWLRDVTEPVLFVFGAVPVLVVAPFFLVWFGTGVVGKLALVAFYCFVVVAVVVQSAALGIAPVHEEYAATLGLGDAARFRAVVLPACLPAVMAGLRLALATGIGLEASAELLGSRVGVGRLIAVRAAHGDVAGVLALSIALGLVAVGLDAALRAAAAQALRWQP